MVIVCYSCPIQLQLLYKILYQSHINPLSDPYKLLIKNHHLSFPVMDLPAMVPYKILVNSYGDFLDYIDVL